MAKKKRHSNGEIAAKLAHADDLASEGKLQSEIAHALGVSVMTLHRWRKASTHLPSAPAGLPTRPHVTRPEAEDDEARDIAELQLENSRLRRLVADLLLEKVKLEEAAQAARSSGKRAVR